MAIKVLPDEFAQDEERLRRFQREAKVLASLNHLNIAAIYGLERSGSTHYLVLELVKGETLAERLARGAIPIDEAIEIAKAFVEDAPDAESSMSPTLTRDATRVGVILGTAAYMSPEQAKGKSVDKRADIWAFGAVVYEMLTGARAFTGEDVSDTLAAVLRAEPEWDAVPADVSPAVRTALARCLEKDLKRRVRDIGDVKLAMEGAFESAASRWTADAAPSGGIWQRQGLALAVALSLLSGLAVWAWMTALSRDPGRGRFW